MLAFVCCFGLCACSSSKPTGGSVTATQSSAPEPATIIDVRTTEEFNEERLPGTINVPMAELETKILEIAPDKEAPLVLHCQSGARSARAKNKLAALGYKNVKDLGSFEDARAALQ